MQKRQETYPKNTTGNGPGMHPDCGDSHHAEDMCEFSGARVGIPPKLAPKLGQVGDVLRPGECERKRPEAEDDRCCGQREDDEDEQQRGVNLID